MTVPATVRRVARPLMVLALLVALAVPAIATSRRVQLRVDGALTQVRTYGATVAEILVDHGVEVAAGDAVLPAPTSEVTDGTVIRVLRSIDVDVDVDGVVTTVRGTFRTVEGALAAAGVVPDDLLLVEPAPRTAVEDGDVVVVRAPRTVTVVADGTSRTVRTHLDRVGRLLDQQGLRVAADDLVSHPRGAALVDGMELVVERVGFDERVREVEVEFPTETVGTTELFRGESRVVQEGEPGLRIDTFEVTLVDGEVAERVKVASEVVREPVPRIVEEGTTPRPPRRMADDGSVWFDLAQCESGGRWDYDGPSGYDGGLQFHPDTWLRYRPAGAPQYAWQASPAVQIEAGKRLQAAAGWGQWPSCARKLGLL